MRYTDPVTEYNALWHGVALVDRSQRHRLSLAGSGAADALIGLVTNDMLNERDVVARMSDVYAALPAFTGKMALEYEGELVGTPTIARELLRRAADQTLRKRAVSALTRSQSALMRAQHCK